MDEAELLTGPARLRRVTKSRVILVVLVALAVAAATLWPRTAHHARRAVAAAATSAPETFFALLLDRAVEESPEQQQQDYGKADAITTGLNGPWIARHTTPCRSVMTHDRTSFTTKGLVTDLAASPDGHWLAYGRVGCSSDALVVRNIQSGAEQVWPSDSRAISSLSWSSDNHDLVFQLSPTCCGFGGPTPHQLDLNHPPVSIVILPPIATALDQKWSLHDPTYAGSRLLLLADRFEGEQHAVVDVAGHVVAHLQEEANGLDADSSGQHLLVTLYGGSDGTSSLLAFTGADFQILGRGYTSARW